MSFFLIIVILKAVLDPSGGIHRKIEYVALMSPVENFPVVLEKVSTSCVTSLSMMEESVKFSRQSVSVL